MTHRARVLLVIFLGLLCFPSTPAFAQYIYVANAGDDTVSKIDVNLMQVVATYRTWFGPYPGPSTAPLHNSQVVGPNLAAWTGPAPSRIAVDAAGNAFVLNRFIGSAHLPVLVKILPSGGTPPTTTSSGYQALPMTDNSPTNGLLDPGEAQDVRIAWAVPVGDSNATPTDLGATGRALCLDLNGYLWVGLYFTGRYYKVSPVTGAMLPIPPIKISNHTPYGCVVDAQGTLWSTSGSGTVAQIDTKTDTLVKVWDHTAAGTDGVNHGRNYSITTFGGCGSSKPLIYLSDWDDFQPAQTYIKFDPLAVTPFSNQTATGFPKFRSLAIAATRDGHLVSGEYAWPGFATGRVIKYSPFTGAVIWDKPSQVTTSGLREVRGIIVDENDDVWTVNRQDHSVSKFSGFDGTPLGTVKVGDSPYTYSNLPPPNCPCAQIVEKTIQCQGVSGGVGQYSYSFIFTNNSPFPAPASCMTVSSTDVTGFTPPSPFQFTPIPPGGHGAVTGTFTVANPQPGKPVCLDIQLQNSCEGMGWCCPGQQVCFNLPECRECAKAVGKFYCRGDGTWALALTVTNGGPATTTSVEVSSTTPGVTVTPATTAVTLAANASATIQLTVSGAAPGQSIGLTVNFHGPMDPKTGAFTWCCRAKAQVVYPKAYCIPTGDIPR